MCTFEHRESELENWKEKYNRIRGPTIPQSCKVFSKRYFIRLSFKSLKGFVTKEYTNSTLFLLSCLRFLLLFLGFTILSKKSKNYERGTRTPAPNVCCWSFSFLATYVNDSSTKWHWHNEKNKNRQTVSTGFGTINPEEMWRDNQPFEACQTVRKHYTRCIRYVMCVSHTNTTNKKKKQSTHLKW